jgi:membrane-bound lytic murein transglycosylase D
MLAFFNLPSVCDSPSDSGGPLGRRKWYRNWGHLRSWYLAAAAYNTGAVRVSYFLQRYTDGRFGDDDLYWEITVDHLPSETANYVPKLLAATYLARSAQGYGLDVRPMAPYEYDFVWSPAGVDLSDAAYRLEITAEYMNELNPQLIRHARPPGEIYPLGVPVGTASQMVAALALPSPALAWQTNDQNQARRS